MPAAAKRTQASRVTRSTRGTAEARGPRSKKLGKAAGKPSTADIPIDEHVHFALDALRKGSTKHDHDNLARFGITAKNALGVNMAVIQKLAKNLGASHELADALWKSGVYEARLLASYVDEPERVTPAQMDRWCRDFDNWGICDTVCFVLFDRTPHAWRMIAKWSTRKKEYEKRAAFALLASLAGHDKQVRDGPFLESSALIERASDDDRNFV